MNEESSHIQGILDIPHLDFHIFTHITLRQRGNFSGQFIQHIALSKVERCGNAVKRKMRQARAQAVQWVTGGNGGRRDVGFLGWDVEGWWVGEHSNRGC